MEPISGRSIPLSHIISPINRSSMASYTNISSKVQYGKKEKNSVTKSFEQPIIEISKIS